MVALALNFLDTANPQQVKALSPEQLRSLKEQLSEAIDINTHRKQVLENGLRLKYEERAENALREAYQDTGTTHIKEGGLVVTVRLPKKVLWDQQKLGPIIEEIPLHERYPAITYTIKEEHYKVWTPQRQMLFMPARTLMRGTPVFSFKEENHL